MKRIFSGVKPTGGLHLGNYLGALRNWLELQSKYENFFCIVDYHAITLPQNPKLLAQRTAEIARNYLAAGINPAVSTIFVQSDVTAHTELAWMLNCQARIGELERMTQFKEKGRSQEREAVSAGLLNYPVLMAADILLYQTDLVPVGEDQKQHLELTRDLAQRFNRDYGETFRIPEPFIPKAGARIMSLSDPTKKMAKSDVDPAGSIGLLDDADTVTRKFKRAVTDSGTEIKFDNTRPAITNLLTIYALLTNQTNEQVENNFAGKGYGQLKSELSEACIAFLQPFQERFHNITDEALRDILTGGARRARESASHTLDTVKERLGIVGAKNL